MLVEIYNTHCCSCISNQKHSTTSLGEKETPNGCVVCVNSIQFNILFFQSTGLYNKVKLNGQPATECLENKRLDTKCYDKMIDR